MILIIFNEICDNFFQQEGGSLCCNRGFLFAISEGDACVGVEAQETGSRENSQGVRQGCRGWAVALLPSSHGSPRPSGGFSSVAHGPAPFLSDVGLPLGVVCCSRDSGVQTACPRLPMS